MGNQTSQRVDTELQGIYRGRHRVGLVQEDRSGNSYAGGNGHTAKIARVNKLTSDVYEEKTSFGTFSQSLELLK